MLTNDWIILIHLQFLWCSALVFSRCVEMPGAGGRNQFNLVTHNQYSSNLLATGTQLIENRVNPLFIDDTHPMRRYAQLYKPPLTFHPKAMFVQIWQKPAPGFVIGVGYIISGDWTLASHLTDSRHRISLQPAIIRIHT